MRALTTVVVVSCVLTTTQAAELPRVGHVVNGFARHDVTLAVAGTLKSISPEKHPLSTNERALYPGEIDVVKKAEEAKGFATQFEGSLKKPYDDMPPASSATVIVTVKIWVLVEAQKSHLCGKKCCKCKRKKPATPAAASAGTSIVVLHVRNGENYPIARQFATSFVNFSNTVNVDARSTTHVTQSAPLCIHCHRCVTSYTRGGYNCPGGNGYVGWQAHNRYWRYR